MKPRAVGFTVERVAFEDFPEVRRLFLALHEYNARLDERFALAEHWEPHLYSAFCDGVDHESQLWLLAWEGDRAVGFLWGKTHRDSRFFRYSTCVELVAIYVDPDTRASGVGRELVQRLREWTAAVGYDTIQAFVTSSNELALSFYDREGFTHSQSIVRLVL